MPGARRVIKLPFTEKQMQCPHCRATLTIPTVMGTITLSSRRCPKCGKDFVIENDVPRKPDAQMKKPSGSARAARAGKRKSKSGV